MSEIAQALWAVFGDGVIHYARAYFDRNIVAYHPVDQPLTIPVLVQHLEGDQTFGAYQLLPDSTVKWVAWDVDTAKIETARKYAQQLLDAIGDIPHCVEFSGGKGYHIFVFLDSPVPASKAKLFVETIRAMAGVPQSGTDHVETFPKQAMLTASNPYGNLMKMPLGLHPRTHQKSRFVDPNNGWEVGPEIPPIEVLNTRVKFADLLQLIRPIDPTEALQRLLIPVWATGNRHDLALSLSGFLATAGWGFEQTKELIAQIAAGASDDDLANRLECVTDTYQTLAAGGSLVGLSLLRNLLPGGLLNQIMALAGQVATPDPVLEVDRIRLVRKQPVFLKVRSAERAIWANLLEGGIPLQTITNQKYWYCRENHQLLDLERLDWEAYLIHNYGLNMKDSFGKQVGREILLHFHRDAKLVEVFRRSAWIDDLLYIHLDGPQVYILDGEQVRTSYNGECGLMFHSLGDTPVQLDAAPWTAVNVWEELIDDLNFAPNSEQSLASAEEQRELFRVWILALFFSSLLHVRPMLCCLGAPGSGKTSALRRLLRIIESPNQDVLGLVLDKPDAFRSTLSYHKLIILDNLEKTKARWLVDILNRIVTGSEIELRKLYATNERVRIIPDVFLAVTAVSLPFDEETLYSRILPLELDYITKPIPEHLFQQRLIKRRPAIWYSLVQDLNQVVRSLRTHTDSGEKYAGRLADFVAFGQRLKSVPFIRWDILDSATDTLQSRQKILLRDASGFVQLLEMWMDADPTTAAQPHTIAELWKIMQPLAKPFGTQWTWKNPRALSPHVRSLTDLLRKYYGLTITHDQVDMEGNKSKPRYAFTTQIPF